MAIALKTVSYMKNMTSIDPLSIDGNFIKMIGRQWMLITAGTVERFNTMTASWGAVGEIWGKHAVFVFVRPQRYTFGFMESNELFTLSFFGDGYRKELAHLGSVSGRDEDKVSAVGLTPLATASASVGFVEAPLILECKKMYAGSLEKDYFADQSIPGKVYPENDFHKMYVGNILNAWISASRHTE